MNSIPDKCRDLAESRREAERVLPRLGVLVDAILEANGHMNLTADGEPDLFWVRHVEGRAVDRPAAGRFRWAGRERRTRLLDVGSGGRPAGIGAGDPLAPRRGSICLKRAAAGRTFSKRRPRAWGWGEFRCWRGRAETLAHQDDHREKYNVVTARARGSHADSLGI